MDQVKQYLAVLKKYHFWVLTIVVLIASLLSWFQASAAISSLYTAKKSQVESKFSDMTQVSGVADHPNETFVTGAKGQHNVLRNDVLAAWKKLYDAQKEKLVWPNLSQNFTKFITENPKRLTPIPTPLCEVYRSHAEKRLDDMFAIVQPFDDSATNSGNSGRPQNTGNPMRTSPGNPMPETGPRAGGSARNGQTPSTDEAAVPVKPEGVVLWSLDRRQRIRSRFTWPTGVTPTSKAVWYAQEDFWVFENLLRVIAAVNGGATEQSQATVRAIESLDIGKDTAGSRKILGPIPHTTPPAAATTSNSGGAPGAPGATESADSADAKLESGRYCNAQGAPVATEGESGGEYRLMQVVMELVIDQNRLFDVLAACINATLPIQLQQVSLQPMTAAKDKQTSGEKRGPADPNEMLVLIRGFVYLFNEPDPAKLGIEPPAAVNANGNPIDPNAVPGTPGATPTGLPGAAPVAGAPGAPAPTGAAVPGAVTPAAPDPGSPLGNTPLGVPPDSPMPDTPMPDTPPDSGTPMAPTTPPADTVPGSGEPGSSAPGAPAPTDTPMPEPMPMATP